MATRTTRICDVDEKHEGDVEQIVFSDGEGFFIADLCTPDADKLIKAIEPFVKVATQVDPKDVLRNANGSAYSPQVVRAWALRKGKQLGDRGRIPADVVAEWKADTGN